jgi:hypothetical protein
VRLQQHQAQRFARKLVEQVAHLVDVADGLRHLLAAALDEAVVHPVARHRRAVAALALRDLVLVVREDYNYPPGVYD